MKRKEYFDRVYGCWLGKNIGGTMGMPFEGEKEFLNLPMAFPEKMLPNDDLDLQLVWLDILRKKGIKISSLDLAKAWGKNIIYAFDEYGVAIANLKMGLNPPLSGMSSNWFKNCMGAPIRSEIWACISPGRPGVAGWYAYQDSSVDHWDEGVYGEIFFACLESMAFINSNVEELIRNACLFLPKNSKVRKTAELALELFKNGCSLTESRERIIKDFGHHNFTDGPQNIGFTILGLLYGKGDFLKTITAALSCGYDTDCTASSAGAIIGIILGREGVVKNSGLQINEEIKTGEGIRGIEAPKTLTELTENTLEIGVKVLAEKNLPAISRSFTLPCVAPEHIPARQLPCIVSRPFTPDSIKEAEKKFLSNGMVYPGKKNVFNGPYFELGSCFGDAENASIFISTNFRLGENKRLKVFPASTDGVKLWIDGKLVLSHHKHGEFLPAPHRPGSPLVELEMEKGWHRVLLEINRCGKNPEFGWIVADRNNHLVTNLEYKETAVI